MSQYKRPNKKVMMAKRLTGGTVNLALKLLVCLIFFFPFYWMIISAFKTNYESSLFPPTLWPQTWTLEGFEKLFRGIDFGPYLKNSLIIVVVNTVLMTLIMVPAAYVFAKHEFKGKNVFFMMVMVAFMVPSCVTFVTVFRMFSELGWIYTLLPQILPCICNCWGIFLLRQNFMQVPEEMIESARLDEASELQIIFKIMLPMAKSTIVMLMLLSVMGTWNSYFWPLVMTLRDSERPLPVAIESLKNLEAGLDWPVIMAGNFILVIPILIAFLLFSKKIISAMAYKGIK